MKALLLMAAVCCSNVALACEDVFVNSFYQFHQECKNKTLNCEMVLHIAQSSAIERMYQNHPKDSSCRIKLDTATQAARAMLLPTILPPKETTI